MRVYCEFCGNAVEMDGNMTCPHCGGSLGENAMKEEERREQERLQNLELEKQRLKKEAAEADNEKWGKIVGSAALSGLTGQSLFDRIGRYIGKFLKSLIIIAIILVAIIVIGKLLG